MCQWCQFNEWISPLTFIWFPILSSCISVLLRMPFKLYNSGPMGRFALRSCVWCMVFVCPLSVFVQNDSMCVIWINWLSLVALQTGFCKNWHYLYICECIRVVGVGVGAPLASVSTKVSAGRTVCHTPYELHAYACAVIHLAASHTVRHRIVHKLLYRCKCDTAIAQT